MKVLFINPEIVTTTKDYFELPLNLAYLSAYLIEGGITPHVIDLQLDSREVLIDYLKKNNTDIIGIPTYSYNTKIVNDLCGIIKKISNAIIILGGNHVSFIQNEAFSFFNNADGIIIGEAEYSFFKFCKLFEKGLTFKKITKELKNISFRTNKQPLIFPQHSDINSLPFASRSFDLFKIQEGLNRNPTMPFLTSRGCFYSCNFCASNSFWGKIRIRNWENIKQELEYYRHNNYSTINFVDDSFTQILALKTKMLDFLRYHKFEWWCETRLDHLSPGKIKELTTSGLKRIRVSVETIHDSSLKKLNKKIKTPPNIDLIKLLTDNIPYVQVSFMLGIPGETKEMILETIEFAQQLKPAIVKFWAFTPLPGTDYWLNPKEHGITKIYKTEEFNTTESFIDTDALDKTNINELLLSAWKHF